MKTLKLLLIGLALALPTVGRATIIGSLHDFSTNSWNTSRHSVCAPCHQAHDSDSSLGVPLWNHTTTTASFIPYTSPKGLITVGQPFGTSLACLSCHDGTVAVNQYGGVTNGTPQYITGNGLIGTDLSHNHPISFTYDTALANSAALQGTLNDPSLYKVGDPVPTAGTTPPVPASWTGASLTGQTLDQALLVNHVMQCTSCHDPHKQVGSSPTSGIMLKISGTDANSRGDLICRNCHLK
jgi:hypothetical protein